MNSLENKIKSIKWLKMIWKQSARRPPQADTQHQQHSDLPHHHRRRHRRPADGEDALGEGRHHQLVRLVGQQPLPHPQTAHQVWRDAVQVSVALTRKAYRTYLRTQKRWFYFSHFSIQGSSSAQRTESLSTSSAAERRECLSSRKKTTWAAKRSCKWQKCFLLLTLVLVYGERIIEVQ